MANQENAAAKVETVFAAIARGDASDTDTLLALGDAIVPAVSGYLSSADENVRTQAVALLAALGTGSAAKALLPTLADSSDAIRERAARGILAEVMKTGKLAGLDSAVAKGLAAGEPGAAALLLGAFSEQSRGPLGQAVGSTRLVKLADGSRPVTAGLAAQVALSSIGDSSAGTALEKTIAGDDIDELIFLLDVLPLIDKPTLIHSLAAQTLDDERHVAGGVPAGAEPARRVADRAVDALVARLNLKVSFDPNEAGRYTAAQIAEVRKAVSASIPH